MDAFVAAAEGSNTQSGILCTYEDAVRTYELVSTLHLRHMHMLIAILSDVGNQGGERQNGRWSSIP
jgi:hypothetical protein